MESESPSMTGFLASQAQYDDFRVFIRSLLDTFVDNEDDIEIFMSETVKQVQPKKFFTDNFPDVEDKAFGLDDNQNLAEGPFSIIKRAFTHAYVNDINLETLETLGDAVLNAAVTFIIVHNWPNLCIEVKQVANMKKYHTNNTNLAKYAEKLGLIRWIVRHENQGLDTKERADVFEAFIGAVALIGEMYIGPEMGFVYAKQFLIHFFATEKWYPHDSDFYEVGETLYNDWFTALPKNGKPKKSKMTKRDPETGMWYYWVQVEDDENATVKSITDKIGVPKVSASATARKKDDAKHAVMTVIARELKIQRSDINLERDKKHAANAEIYKIVSEIIEIGKKAGKEVFVTGSKRAGKRYYVFVKEKVKAKMSKTTLTYERFVVNGEGANDKEALENARGKMMRQEYYKTVAGFEYEIWNPDANDTNDPGLKPNSDQQDITGDVTIGARKPKSEGRGKGRGRGRGFTTDRPYKPKRNDFEEGPPKKSSGPSYMSKK